ncbi:hypothetical protein AURDEDRAFT_118841 [Auricularia subglabra TFB-10046 SS5]|nr:hypothetical protein AURDEDRAFT_118841 [Auricularia subglabra TFB-10046 SS5]
MSTSPPPSRKATLDSADHSHLPVFQLRRTSHRDGATRRSFLCISEPDAESSACDSEDIFPLPSDDESEASSLPMPGAWIESSDHEVSSLVDSGFSVFARPLSWASIMPLSPDMPADRDSVLDFRAAVDLVRDYDSLPSLDRDDDTEDAASLRTPLRTQAYAPFDFALRSTWSDSESESESELDCDCNALDFDCDSDALSCACNALGGDAEAALSGVAFPLLPGPQQDERVSVASLSLFPSPPGTPAFGERFSAISHDPLVAPKRPCRIAVPHLYAAVVEPESPTARTARIRRETLARLESRV